MAYFCKVIVPIRGVQFLMPHSVVAPYSMTDLTNERIFLFPAT